jgi:glycosyltransferase involved in cell wall biosynthesis
MRVLYDHQVFDMQRVGGISRYFTELVKNLPESVEPCIPVKYTVNQYLKDIPSFAGQFYAPPDYYTSFMGGRVFRGRRQLYNLKKKYFPEPDLTLHNKELSIAALEKGNFDIFHPTYYDDYFLKYIGNKPFVLTVYDMIHEIYPEYFMQDEKNRMISHMKKALLQKASRIIAISENTKKDILSICRVDEAKITVTHLSSSLAMNVIAQFPAELPKRFLLFVGNRDGYKNFYFFISAVYPLIEEDQNLHIVCTGRRFSPEEKAFIHSLDLTNHIHQYFVEDDQLAFLYKNALAFVFPSLYEGFGIPVLEAFACGCPALLSHSSSLPEVGSEAAIYFDPKNAFSIREAVKKVIYDEEKRKDLIDKGYKQLQKFSWSNVGLSTYQVYRQVLSNYV